MQRLISLSQQCVRPLGLVLRAPHVQSPGLPQQCQGGPADKRPVLQAWAGWVKREGAGAAWTGLRRGNGHTRGPRTPQPCIEQSRKNTEHLLHLYPHLPFRASHLHWLHFVVALPTLWRMGLRGRSSASSDRLKSISASASSWHGIVGATSCWDGPSPGNPFVLSKWLGLNGPYASAMGIPAMTSRPMRPKINRERWRRRTATTLGPSPTRSIPCAGR